MISHTSWLHWLARCPGQLSNGVSMPAIVISASAAQTCITG